MPAALKAPPRMGGASKFGKSFSRVSRRSPERVALTLSENYIKVVHARETAENFKVQGVWAKALKGESDEEISRMLTDYVASAGISPDQMICTIAARSFISKNIEIPSTNRVEIAKIIDLQAGRLSPYSRDEIIVDFLCMDTLTQHYTSVLLIILNRKFVERYMKILERAELSLTRILITPETMGVAYGGMAPPGQESQVFSGLHVGEDASDLTIFEKGQLIFVRGIPVGASQLGENPETARAEFLSELQKSLASYQDQGIGSPVKSLLITGAGEYPETLKQAIQESSEILKESQAIVKAFDYRRIFTSSEEAFRRLEAEKEASFFEPLSALFYSRRAKIDLTPSEIKLRRQFRETSRDIIMLGILIMSLCMMITLFLGFKVYIKNTLLGKYEEIHGAISEEARSLERVSTKTRVVRKLLEVRGRGLKIFDIVSGLIGSDIYLADFQYRDNGKLVLIGTAQSMSKVFAFVTKLEESNYFSKVKTKETKSRREGSDDVADFQIRCRLAEGI